MKVLNYELRYSVSDIAKLLDVDRKLIKDWAYHFSDYLNSKANPPKGIEREFTSDDLCTLSYVLMYWEDDPDIENIKYGLNSDSQFEYPFTQIAIEATPIFREFSEEFVDSNAWMIGGMAEIQEKITLADSYKKAGDTLVHNGIDDYNIDFIYPAIFNYRHAIELYLKHILIGKINTLPNEGKIHNLKVLYTEFKELLSESFNVTPPRWFENIILAFVDFDPTGTTFRYGTSIKSDEMFIDLYHIKKMMTWFAESIHNVDAEIKNNHR